MGRLQPQDEQAQARKVADDTEVSEDESVLSGEEVIDDEFHTEDEDDEELLIESDLGDAKVGEEDEDEEEHALEITTQDTAPTSVPLLPAHLLKPEPSPDDATLETAIPTRKQRRAQSAKDRKAKRQLYAKIRRDARGSGVLEAGAAARMRRGLALSGNRVASGRVQKKSSRPTQNGRTGRQQLLDKRKREESSKEDVPLVVKKKQKTGSKR